MTDTRSLNPNPGVGLSTAASWLSTLSADAPAQAPPPYVLTTIELGSRDRQRQGDWSLAVRDMVVELVGRGQPVLYVESGGYRSYCGGEELIGRCGSALLRTHLDEDVHVYTPPMLDADQINVEDATVTADGRLYYSCKVPTLQNVAADLAEHELAHGPAAVVFDEVMLMRPYLDVADPESNIAISLSDYEAADWRATDLLAFAEARPAPTLAVWDNCAGPLFGLDVLIAASAIHVAVEVGPDEPGVRVAVRQRASATELWPQPTFLHMPWTV
jgi:hypothetical protein